MNGYNCQTEEHSHEAYQLVTGPSSRRAESPQRLLVGICNAHGHGGADCRCDGLYRTYVLSRLHVRQVVAALVPPQRYVEVEACIIAWRERDVPDGEWQHVTFESQVVHRIVEGGRFPSGHCVARKDVAPVPRRLCAALAACRKRKGSSTGE